MQAPARRSFGYQSFGFRTGKLVGASGKLKVARARATPPLRCARPRTMFGWVPEGRSGARLHSTRSLDPVQAGSQCATLSRPGCSLASQPQHRRPAAAPLNDLQALRHPLIARSARGGPTKLVCKHQGTRWGPNEWRRNGPNRVRAVGLRLRRRP